MIHDNYWPQAQLYMYATCALFPEKIEGKTLSDADLSEYIPFLFEIDEQTKVLEGFKSKGMLDFKQTALENEHAEYVINEIDSGKFTEFLTGYLEMFRNDELLSDPSAKPEPFSALEKRLIGYLASTTRHEPMINPMNIWSNWTTFDSHRFPFWEVILAAELVTRTTQILDMGLSPLGNNHAIIPYAQVEVMADIATGSTSNDSVYQRAEVVIEKDWKTRKLLIRLEDKQEFILNASMRTDQAPHSLMRYLIDHPGQNVDLAYARRRIEGCETVKKLSEVLRQCGFDDILKPIFFDKSSDRAVQLKKDPVVRISDIKLSKSLK